MVPHSLAYEAHPIRIIIRGFADTVGCKQTHIDTRFASPRGTNPTQRGV